MKVQEWEKREEKFRKAWDRVWGICWGTVLAMTILVVAVVIWKEWYFHGDPVKAGLREHAEGNWNQSLRLGGGGKVERVILGSGEELASGPKGQPSVPDDIQEILAGIAERNRVRKNAFPEVPYQSYKESKEGSGKDLGQEDPRFRKLDEL